MTLLEPLMRTSGKVGITKDNMAIEEVERFDDISALVFFGCRTGTIEAHCYYGWKH